MTAKRAVHHKICLLAHNFMFFPSLVRFKLYAIVFTQGRSRDCKLQGGKRVLDYKPVNFDWETNGCIILSAKLLKKLESQQNSFPRLARVSAPSYLSNTCFAPSTTKMRFSDSPVGRQSQK